MKQLFSVFVLCAILGIGPAEAKGTTRSPAAQEQAVPPAEVQPDDVPVDDEVFTEFPEQQPEPPIPSFPPARVRPNGLQAVLFGFTLFLAVFGSVWFIARRVNPRVWGGGMLDRRS